jgi:hypothetical protein
MILIIPSAVLLDSEMRCDTGAQTHALIDISGKPLFFHIVESYKKLCQDDDLIVILVVKTGVKKLLDQYEKYVDKCVEIDDSRNLLDTVSKGIEELDSMCNTEHSVIVHMADTLLPDNELTLQADCIYASYGSDFYRWTIFHETNGVIRVDSDRTLISKDRENKLLSIGIFSFSSLSSLRQTLLEIDSFDGDVDPFFKAVELYSDKKPISVRIVNKWLDFGHLDTYHESKLNYQNLRHFNSLEFNNKTGTVTKKSKDPNFIHQVRWFKLQPSELQFYLPRVYELNDGKNPYISMEILTIPTLSELFVNKRLELGAWPTVINKLKDILKLYSGYRYESDVTYSMLHSMYVTKTIQRLNEYLENNPSKKGLRCSAFPDGYALFEIPNLIEEYVNKYRLLTNSDLTPIHGDFCLTNLLYDKRSRLVKMIDPRGVFSVPGIYGDSRYDIAKLYHSIISGYDFIISDRFSVDVNQGVVECKIDKTKYHHEVGKITREILSPDPFFNHQIRVIESLLFLSMLPLHQDRPDRQLAMISIGLELFNHYFSMQKGSV